MKRLNKPLRLGVGVIVGLLLALGMVSSAGAYHFMPEGTVHPYSTSSDETIPPPVYREPLLPQKGRHEGEVMPPPMEEPDGEETGMYPMGIMPGHIHLPGKIGIQGR